MDQDKFGKFIKELREEKGWTQQDLADMIPIDRTAISKWELGKRSPDTLGLKKLSELFEITINELLSGEKNVDEHIVLNILEDRNKFKNRIKFLMLIICILLILFLSYYFINQFNSIHVYTMNAENRNFELINSMVVKTKEKIYFNIGNIKIKNDINIENVELYYLYNNKKEIIYSSEDKNIYFFDYNGYEEYFPFSDFKEILKNMYLKIQYKKSSKNMKYDIIKLNFIKDYANNNLTFKKYPKINNNINNNLKNNKEEELINKIKKTYKKEEDKYYLILNDNKKKIEYLMINNKLIVTIYINNVIVEDYNYDLKYSNLLYNKYQKKEILFSYNCLNNCVCEYGNCSKNTNILSNFNKIVQDSFK